MSREHSVVFPSEQALLLEKIGHDEASQATAFLLSVGWLLTVDRWLVFLIKKDRRSSFPLGTC